MELLPLGLAMMATGLLIMFFEKYVF